MNVADNVPTTWRWHNPSQRLLCVSDVQPQSSTLQLPLHLAELFQQLAPTRPSQSDILIGLIYAVALECGFCCAETADDDQRRPAFEPSSCWFSFNAGFVRAFADSWPAPATYYDYADDLYTMPMRLHGLSERRCSLVGQDIGGVLCVSLNGADGVDGKLHGTSVCLTVAEYVVKRQLTDAARCVKNVGVLVDKLRDRLFVPMRNRLLADGDRPGPSMLGMPIEIRLAVYEWLGLADLQRWSGVCQLARAEAMELERVKRCL